ncbi:hypothetical protein [Streptomyces sp. NPDC044948]|uniref:hypothetical protein n=1 Tax=Streptomyces sp. NPDC044948 TaxID=3157092 RepID=UPI0033C69A32
MAALTTNVVPLVGLRFDNLMAAATSGDDCATGTGVLLIVNNGSAASVTVTLATPETVDGDLAVDDREVAVAASGWAVIPVTDRYRNPSTGRCAITYSAAADVTVGVVRTAAA